MKTKYTTLALFITLFVFSCKKSNVENTPVDKIKVNTIVKNMFIYNGYLSLEGSPAPVFINTVISNKLKLNPIASISNTKIKSGVSTTGVDSFDDYNITPQPMGGVYPTITETDNEIIYTYDFDALSYNSTEYDGKLIIKMGISLFEFYMQITFEQFKDNTLAPSQNNKINNLTNGYIKLSSALISESIMLNSDLTVVMDGLPTYNMKYQNFSIKETNNGEEYSGKMTLSIGNDTYLYEYINVVSTSECLYPTSGKLNVTYQASGKSPETFEINFGTGNCDNIVSARQNGGNFEDVNIE